MEPVIKIRVKKQTHRNYINFYYNEEAVNLVKKLSKYAGVKTSRLMRLVITKKPIVAREVFKEKNSISTFLNIQKTLKSNLTQMADLSKFIEDEFAIFNSFSKDNFTIQGKQYNSYQALNYYLKSTSDFFNKFLNMSPDYFNDDSEEFLEIIEKIKTINYLCGKDRKSREVKENRLYIYLLDDDYKNFKDLSKDLANTKQYLLDKNNKSKKPNLTASFWYLLSKVEIKKHKCPLENNDLILLKKAADEFNEVIHKANTCKLNAEDFKPKEIYDAAVNLYKEMKAILNNKQ
jgi:hypothetical protein